MIRSSVLGPILNRIRLHRVEFRDQPDGLRLVAKRRRWWAKFALPPGNLYLRWLGAGVEVLSEHAWHRRERAVHRAAYAVDCPIDPSGWLLLPRWPGLTLADYIADRDRPPAERHAALAAAGLALLRFHRVDPDGSGGLSHGDPTLRNVQYDPATGRAVWFDFDTAHRPVMGSVDRRHADDLRTLLASAVSFAGDLPVADLLGTVRAAYVEPAPWWCLADWLRLGPIFHSTFHFAQAPTPPERRAELEALLARF